MSGKAHFVVGDGAGYVGELADEYIAALLREMDCTKAITQSSFAHTALRTLYIGGGTPSLLSVEQLKAVIDGVIRTFGSTGDIEITLEMDPGTFDRTKLASLLGLGINRVSLGIQSFDDGVLKRAGRAHTCADALRALEHIAACELPNYSIDLIGGLPYLTDDIWSSTLDQAVRTRAPHVSVYDLQMEENSAFGRWYQPSKWPLPTEDQAASMYMRASAVLRGAGYEHYEVSNYALSREWRSKHNQVYWSHAPYWAFGIGAASFLMGQRLTRPRKVLEYYHWVQLLEEGNTHTITELLGHKLGQDAKERLLERIMLALRTSDGLNLTQLRHETREFKVESTILSALQEYLRTGVAELVTADAQGRPADTVVRLTDPTGFLISNDIISSIFAALD